MAITIAIRDKFKLIGVDSSNNKEDIDRARKIEQIVLAAEKLAVKWTNSGEEIPVEEKLLFIALYQFLYLHKKDIMIIEEKDYEILFKMFGDVEYKKRAEELCEANEIMSVNLDDYLPKIN